jgi:hypothetical protein
MEAEAEIMVRLSLCARDRSLHVTYIAAEPDPVVPRITDCVL